MIQYPPSMPPIPQLNRRRYGYIKKKNNERPARSHGRAKSTVLRHLGRGLRFILVLPFKILWRLGRTLRRQLIGFILTIIVLGGLAGTVMAAWISRDLPDPDKLTDRRVAQSTKIYDRTGTILLYEIFADQKRTLIEFDQIPPQLITAVLATEDTEFYKHKGVRPLSIARALLYGLFSKRRIGGTSTLTQQLVKNAILTNERTITRKIKEVILALRLEQKYSKEQIIKIYFNEIPYGSTNYGVEAAAQSYFGQSVSNLNLEQIATLAGLPKAPSRYLQNKAALKNRRDFVLERMFEEGYITRAEADATQAESVSLKQRIGDIKAPHFVFYIREQLVEKFGEQLVDTGGLKVITTLDWGKQQLAEQAIAAEAAARLTEAKANNVALVGLDPKTGQVLALVGSRDFRDETIDGQFNVATQGLRQPGSSFKPIIYAAAFEQGYTPQTVLFDVATNFAVAGAKAYEPKNYDLKERGLVTMRQALQGSLNIPAVKTLYLVGQGRGIELAERLGYTSLSAGEFGLSLVLGGGEVRLLEHVSAYGVFAANGIRHQPVSLLRVEDARGDKLLEWQASRGERVVDEKAAATLTNVLSDDDARVFVFGANSGLTLPDRPVAAKTGTTNNFVDAWTVGYTPSLVAGVWAGNTNNTPMKRGFGGSKVAALIWNRFMREALKGASVEFFPAPPTIDQSLKPVLRGGVAGSGIMLLVDKVTGKLATSSTPQAYIVERVYIPQHSILHFVNKDDPRGPAPTDPASDPQYAIWEAAIQDWVRRKRTEDPNWQVEFSDPPTESDDLHSLELIPSLQVVSPAASSTLTSRQIDTEIQVTAPRGVSRVTYALDGKVVAVASAHPFNLNHYARGLLDGDHILTVSVEDDVGNRLEERVPFTLRAGDEPPAVAWLGRDETLSRPLFPRVFFLDHFKLDQIKEVRVYKKRVDETARAPLGSLTDFSNLFNNQLLFKWNETPAAGVYELTAELVLKNGNVRESGRINITVQ